MFSHQFSSIIIIAISFLERIHGDFFEHFEFRIINGRKATAAEFPFHAELVKNERHWCGGAILDNWHVVTAAHCVKQFEGSSRISESSLHVRVGNDVATRGGYKHSIYKVYPHPKYVDNAPVDTSDIAIVKVAQPFQFGRTVKPIKLATSAPEEGLKGWVLGFGKQTMMRRAEGPRDLMAVQLPVFNTRKCRSILRSLGNDMFCAGYSSGNRDACVGDSGGPFISGDKLVGIVAWGIGCGRSGVPGAYTIIDIYRKWIGSITK